MDFAAARVKMVDNQIRTTDVTSHETLRAFLSVPREAFVPDERKALANQGKLERKVVADAITKFGIDTEKRNPLDC